SLTQEPAHRSVLGPRFDPGLGDQAFQRFLDSAQALVEERLIRLDHHGGEAGLRRYLRDAGAHEPAADHTNLLDGHARAASWTIDRWTRDVTTDLLVPDQWFYAHGMEPSQHF